MGTWKSPGILSVPSNLASLSRCTGALSIRYVFENRLTPRGASMCDAEKSPGESGLPGTDR